MAVFGNPFLGLESTMCYTHPDSGHAHFGDQDACEDLQNLERDPSEVDESDLELSEGTASITTADWTVETLLSQLRQRRIDLTAPFQRREAWTHLRQSKFIESLFLGLPVPQLVLAERREQRGTFLVIDGKQRLLALQKFGGIDGNDAQPLRLAGLEIRSDLNACSLEDLRGNPAHSQDLSSFDNQTIRTVVVRDWPTEEYLYLVFLRLNTGSVPLSTQELRQALHPGPFLTFADNYSTASEPIRRMLNLEGPDFRMRDVEMLVRYFGFAKYLNLYDGNLKRFLDTTCGLLNEAWGDQEEDLRQVAASCDRAIIATLDVFDTHAFRRWGGERFERSFNRAVFDIMTYYFRQDTIAAAARASRERVVAAYQNLTLTTQEFDVSLRSTTKTVDATFIRLERWGQELSQALQMQISLPRMQAGRILPPEGNDQLD